MIGFHKRNKEQEQEKNTTATQFVLMTAVIYILLGSMLLFVPQIEITTLCYLLCAILVIAGIILIVRYFITDAYRNINEYGFSIGVFCVILGMCALVRVEKVAASFIICIGIALLMTSVLKLQNALDLKHLEERTWAVMLGISLAFLVCSVLIIINPFKNPGTVKAFSYRILILDGIVSLLCNLYLYIILRRHNRKEAIEPLNSGENGGEDTGASMEEEESEGERMREETDNKEEL